MASTSKVLFFLWAAAATGLAGPSFAQVSSPSAGGALDLASAQYLSGPTMPGIGSQVTVEAWVKVRSWPFVENNSVAKPIFYQGDWLYDASIAFMLFQNPGPNDYFVYAAFSEDGGGYRTATAMSATNLYAYIGQWIHVAATYDGSTRAVAPRVYINGVYDLNRYERANSNGTIRVGGRTDIGAGRYNGNIGAGQNDDLIDELRVWNVVRTQQEIVENMNRSLLGSEAGLQAYWKFNGDLVDSGPHAYVMTPNGGAGLSPEDAIARPPPNTRPIANPGPNRDVALGALVSLDGTASTDDRLAAELSYAWLITRPDLTTLALSGPTPTFATTVPGRYRATLTVTDAGGLASDPKDALLLAFGAAPTTPGPRELYVGHLTGYVAERGDSGWPVGTPLEARFVIDVGAVASASQGGSAAYYFDGDPGTGIQFAINGAVLASDPTDACTDDLTVLVGVPSVGSHDHVDPYARFAVQGRSNSLLPDGRTALFLLLELADADGTAVTTRALPRTLALGAFEYARLSFDIGTHLSCGSYSHGAYTYIAISSLTYGPLNEPPVAIAGPPQSVYAGARVQLDATGSTDDGPAGALLFSWRVIAPDGTGFGLAGVAPTFVAQQRGTYSIELVATDAQGAASPPSTTTVLATEPAEYAAAQVRVVLALLAAAPRAVFTSRADRQSLLRALEHVLARLERGRRIGEASRDLARALLRSDGCVERGAPDRSRRRSGEVPDFIDDCGLQRSVYSALSTARLALSTFAGP